MSNSVNNNMEERVITFVSTSFARPKALNTSATTLGELKEDMREAGIVYDGYTFFEGITKTTLEDNAALLPRDVIKEGNVTNNLVFALTKPKNKIASGSKMSRQELYSFVKDNNLQDKCIEMFGKNFTRCSNADLMTLMNSSDTEVVTKVKEEPAKKAKKVSTKSKKVSSKEVKEDTVCNSVKLQERVDSLEKELKTARQDLDNIFEAVKSSLDELSYDYDSLDDILHELNSKTRENKAEVADDSTVVESPYSQDELDALLGR